MQIWKKVVWMLVVLGVLAGCSAESVGEPEIPADAVTITLSDSGITVEGAEADAVYTASDIVYYEAGKDFTYGEGSAADAHSAEEAATHTVVHISKPGTYALTGKLSRGQIAVDLGKDAKEDPSAVVTLILNNVDITCTVAPAIIFYNVYECGSDDAETATKDVDTSAAGANVIIADATTNKISGAYVARIYKPDSVELNAAGTAVENAKKLHKYDGALYSKMSMNVSGGTFGSGKLLIDAANEGLDTELHLTINGGQIEIESGNDGINTNEDGVSVTTINGGSLKILVTGETGEGDGIDSNGWLVINGGTVIAAACSNSADAGIDSDMGIHINGGTVIATGSMLDAIESGGQTYAVFSFASRQKGSDVVELKNADGDAILEYAPQNAYSILIFSAPTLQAGTYTLYSDGKQLSGVAGGAGMGGMRPGNFGGQGGMTMPDGMEIPEGMTPPEGFNGQGGQGFPGGMEMPNGMTPPEGFNGQGGQGFPGGMEMPNGMTPPDGFGGQGGQGFPGGSMPNGFGGQGGAIGAASTEFVIADGVNQFSQIAVAQ